MDRSLFDGEGNRKYLTAKERDLILAAAAEASGELRTLIGVLVHTGCRISEALELTADRVDLREGVIVFETLKSGIRLCLGLAKPSKGIRAGSVWCCSLPHRDETKLILKELAHFSVDGLRARR